MSSSYLHLAFIGPGGPEFIVIVLALLMMFGAKDAPRILRKLNEIMNQIRNTTDGFTREVLYSDLESHTPENDVDDPYEDNCSIEEDDAVETGPIVSGEASPSPDEDADTRDNEDGDVSKT